MIRFAGYELDPQRGELRGRDGEAIKLRPKSFAMLQLLATSGRRVVSKQELIEAIWPNVHVGEDSLFQCIREIRSALGDDRRELVRLVSGRGYLFDADVSSEPGPVSRPADSEPAAAAAELQAVAAPPVQMGPRGQKLRPFGLRGSSTFAIIAGLGTLIGLAAAAPIFGPATLFGRKPPVIAVMPITASADPQLAGMAAAVTERLVDGLAKITQIRVVAPRGTASLSPQGRSADATDFVVSGDLQQSAGSWRVQARMTSTASGEVRWTTSAALGTTDGDSSLQQSRLAASLGYPLALRLNALLSSDRSKHREGNGDSGADTATVVVQQATAVLNQTTKDRFRAAQTMLEKALAADADNVDLEVALASHLMRGVQTVWYDPADIPATESRARSLLDRALQVKPNYIPALEAYCRFLTATNSISESLIACAKTLSLDPWDGGALFNLGLSEMLQGRFDDALATFKQADEYDTPAMARWTWLLGAGLACALLEHYDEAVPWLEQSLAITPATGRTQILLAAVYHRLGRDQDARATMAKALELRPGSNAINVSLPTKNASPIFLAGNDRLIRLAVEAGLPEH
ncbi:MAG TPA: winged helix-turn-helix domain-containing protein [Bradyrhizobium sp.]|nr:winged helix-turn-helix domain-containing protein [Bradyrhizobium sp.]